jgi:glutathione S-transferase
METSRFVLHQHPFASFCQKVLVAFHELELPFATRLVGASRDELLALWPMGKMPVLRDEHADRTVAESSTIIEYVDARADDGPRLVPRDPGEALTVRFWDRFLDAYVELPMQKVVLDALREDDGHDPVGVAEARDTLDRAYGVLDAELARGGWIAGGAAFTLADCGAAPALFYARVVHPWDEAARPHLTRYDRDLMHRPSVVRVVDEARPYRDGFPLPWPPDVDAHQPSS